MKKVLILTLIISFLFSSFVIAQEGLKVTAQVRPRMEINNKDFNADTKANSYTYLRTRVGLQLMPAENLGGFIQFQDSRVYGENSGTLAATDNIDLHQAYFCIKKLFNLPLDLKVGRMELVYGSQRLIGAVGWHNVGRSFDGGMLTLNTKPISIDFVKARLNESGMAGDEEDNNLYAAYGKVKCEKMKIQPFVISEMKKETDFARHTLGIYLAGKMGALSHEIEAAYQMGSMSEDVDIAAYMFTANLNYKLGMSMSPVLSAGVDYLSGDDGEDETKYKVFNTLYATNHKFYGFMDYFLNLPVHTYGKGLMDMHGKLNLTMPCKKTNVGVAFHLFNSTADYTLADETTSTSFGSEIDLTVKHAYSKKVTFVGGFSMFTPGDIFKETKGEDSSSWAYLMAVVNL